MIGIGKASIVVNCSLCNKEKGVTGVSAWTRTELHSHPFRVIQFDLVTAVGDENQEYKYILTARCPFSRFCWLVPLKEKTAEAVAEALVFNVLLDLAMFPTMLQSDNEFLNEVIAHLLKCLRLSISRGRRTTHSHRVR